MMLFLRALFFTVLMPGTAVVWIPRMLAARDAGSAHLGPWRWAGVPLMAAGAAVLLACIVDFARKGRGTLAPIDPPRKLVAVGLYRYVRNPMYVGVVTTLLGEALFFESRRRDLRLRGVARFPLVVLYEEPHLAGAFGDEYERYRHAVPRWIPRLFVLRRVQARGTCPRDMDRSKP